MRAAINRGWRRLMGGWSRSNCISFALALYWRRRAKGKRCYLAIRKSDLARVPHFLVFELRGTVFRVVSFKPVNPKHKSVPPPVFKGRVTWGDAPPNNIIKR